MEMIRVTKYLKKILATLEFSAIATVSGYTIITAGQCVLFNFKIWASLVAQLVKSLPAMQETLVQFLGQDDPLEKG